MEGQDGDKVRMGAGSNRWRGDGRRRRPDEMIYRHWVPPPTSSGRWLTQSRLLLKTSTETASVLPSFGPLSCVTAPNKLWQLWILQPWVCFFFPHIMSTLSRCLIGCQCCYSACLQPNHKLYLILHTWNFLFLFFTGQCHCRHLGDNIVSRSFIVWIRQSGFGSNGIENMLITLTKR